MAFTVLACLFVMCLNNSSPEYVRLGAAVLTVQTAIAYYTSGICKMTSSVWRSGEGLIGVMNTAEFGHSFMANIITNRPKLSQFLSWAMMFGHVFTATAILIGGPLIYPAIAVSLFFHCMIAVLMRLNSFVLAFAATYPSLLFMADWGVRQQLWNDIF